MFMTLLICQSHSHVLVVLSSDFKYNKMGKRGLFYMLVNENRFSCVQNVFIGLVSVNKFTSVLSTFKRAGLKLLSGRRDELVLWNSTLKNDYNQALCIFLTYSVKNKLS